MHFRRADPVLQSLMLLASTLLFSAALLWTNDRKLHALALRLGVAFSPARH